MSSALVAPRLLGSGKTSEVYLMEESGQNFAMKKFRDDVDISLHESEVNVMRSLDHPNIIAMIESRTFEKSIKFEYAVNGELFEFVLAKPFSEKLARYYLVQLVHVLDYLHTIGVVHRDLKLENLFLDEQYILKVGDFGLAGSCQMSTELEAISLSRQSSESTECSDTSSTDSVKYFNDYVGTEKYMAPEIIKRQKYNGEQTDIFAAGVVLFKLIHGFCPYLKQAHESDPFYRLLFEAKYDKYWAVFEKKTRVACSAQFKDLVNRLLECDPTRRITLEEIKQHAWMHGDFPTEEEVFAEMSIRKQL